MKKIILLILCLGLTNLIYSQKEANFWYFGNNAGLDFTNGDPVAIINGQINTLEGCATMSDKLGNLLFYTDGNIVYNKNHIVMNNGNNLHGNSSSTQSAIVVPKPGNPDHYYVFTVDEHNSNLYGLQYSLINMNLDGGLGGVVATEKNVSLLEHCSEKIAAIKSGDCGSILIVAFSSLTGTFPNYSDSHYFNTFHTFKVTSSGVDTTSNTTIVSSGTSDGRGYLKISSDGSKIAAVHSAQNGFINLYDFDNNTGLISNNQTILLNDTTHPNNSASTTPYGIEFSLDSSKLYISSIASGNVFNESPQHGYLWQYNLDGAINNAKLISYDPNNTYRGALQLGPNGKIYRAISYHYFLGSHFLGVINHPNTLGVSCDYQHNAIDLGSGESTQGLPPFMQSLFISGVDIVNDGTGVLVEQLDLCTGETYILEPDTSLFPASTTYSWEKDDIPITPGITTSSFTITDFYGTGNYSVLIDFNDGTTCPFYGKVQIDYHNKPVINTPITIRQCDDDTDGYANIDLILANESISSNFALETITYYDNLDNANNGISPIDTDNFNTDSTTIWVRVETDYCNTVGQVDIIVSAANINFQRSLSICDDYVDADNDDYDGFSEFDLTQFESEILNQFPLAQQPNLILSYYYSMEEAGLQENAIPSSELATFRNTIIDTQKIYIRINNNTNLDCVGLSSNLFIELIIEKLPIVHASTLESCETIANSLVAEFDTTVIPNLVLQGQTDITLTYFESDGTEIPFSTFISTNYVSESKNIRVKATNNTNTCFDEGIITLTVNDLPVANPVIRNLCDDSPDQNDGMSVFDTSEIESEILGGNFDNMEVHYYYTDGTEILPTLPKFFNSGTQTINVEVINTENSSCVSTTIIEFSIVSDNPIFDDIQDQVLCVNLLPEEPLLIKIMNPQETSYTYVWEDEFGNNILPKIDDPQAIQITEKGIYSVTATSPSMCTTTKTFTITESSIPKIETTIIFDNSSHNRVSITVSGIGDYEYSIDDSDPDNFIKGNRVDGHIFNDVSEGKHLLRINDKNGCLFVVKEVILIRFPKYISPNGDGIQDAFYVYGGDDFQSQTVQIFDRFGKTLVVLKDNEKWNGTYLGRIAETEYWFLVELIDQQGKIHQRRGHFSLKK